MKNGNASSPPHWLWPFEKKAALVRVTPPAFLAGATLLGDPEKAE
jgi:hypothetical protein